MDEVVVVVVVGRMVFVAVLVLVWPRDSGLLLSDAQCFARVPTSVTVDNCGHSSDL